MYQEGMEYLLINSSYADNIYMQLYQQLNTLDLSLIHIFIQCEYAHAMGNSMGGFTEYWDMTRREPKYQGGFIWDFADQALAWRSPEGKLIYRYGGDYNAADASDSTFCCNGVLASDRSWHPHA